MKKPIVAKDKNLKQRHRNEKGSATLFVLIAMLFFITLGVMLFIRVSNNSGAQRKDVLKIQSEYNSNNYTDDELEKLYEEAKNSQVGKFLIKVIDSYQEAYHSGDWINSNNDDRLPLTVEANWPDGIATITIEDPKNGKRITVDNKEDLKNLKFGRGDEGQYIITGKTSSSSDETKILVRIDYTAPKIGEITGGEIWKIEGKDEEELTVEINVTDKNSNGSEGSGVEKIEYVLSQTEPDGNAQWKTYDGTQIKLDNSIGEGVYYIYARATDKAGNVSEVKQSTPIQVKNANYIVLTGSKSEYAETLAEAVQKASTTDVSTIKPLKDLTDNSTATINKNVTIDTNGKTLTMAETITVSANKTATFVDTAETKGKLERTTGDLITNNGNIVVNDLTMSSNNYVINGGNNVTVNSGNLNSSDNAVIIASYITVNSGNIISQGRYGIISRANCDIKGGKVEGATLGVCPSNGTLKISGTAEIKGGVRGIGSDAPSHSYTLEMTGGTVIGTADHGIYSKSKNTNITITGGTITGGINSIHIEGENNTVTITGGTITGGTQGIRITGANSTVTIGDYTNALDRTSLVITGTTDYSVNITGATSTLNFYDGKLIGGKHDKMYSGRDVTFSVANDTTVTPLTGHKPYTRENTQTHLFETVLEKQVNVTFNPGEGATVAENNRNVLTNVEYKEKAEDATIANLPTPTKTGYTFKGWNGKNLFSGLEKGKRFDVNTGVEINDDNASVSNYIPVNLSANNKYYLSGLTNTLHSCIAAYNKNKEFIGRTSGSAKEKISFTNNSFTIMMQDLEDKEIKYIRVAQYKTTVNTGKIDDIDNLNIQLEVGDTATAYEPYYITDNTKVVQDQDHELKAVWEANKYAVHFNKNDSQERPAVGEVADQAFVYGQAQNLNANEFVRIGYTFKGWNTKADGTGTSYADKASVSNLIDTANGEVILYAQWEEANATFVKGQTFNEVAKKLAGNLNATFETADTAITQIKYAGIGSGTDQITLEKLKEIKAQAVNSDATITKDTKYVKVSVDTQSNTPIYVWFENGKLYWFSEDDTPYMNATATYMFRQFTKLQTIPELNKIDTSKVTTMHALFYEDSSLTELDVSKFNTNNVTKMSYVFYKCSSLSNLDVSKFKTEKVDTMLGMFYKCSALTELDVSKFDTSKVTTMNTMFYNCSKLTNLDVSHFVTSSATTMSSMFNGCKSLTQLDVSKFDTSNVTDMQAMFSDCQQLTSLDVSNFDTSKVTIMRTMFNGCNGLTQLDLRNFDTSKVTNMWRMFFGCENLTTIYASDKFVTTALTDEAIEDREEGNNNNNHLFDGCTKLVGGSGTAYSAAHKDADYAWIDGKKDNNGVAQPGYFTNHFFVEFNKNDSQEAPATGEMAVQGIPFSNAIALRTNAYTRKGYTFKGWSRTSDGAVEFTNEQLMNYDLNGIKAIAQNTTDDKNVRLTLYAVWMENNYLNTTTNTYYGTLTDALAEIKDNAEAQTIKVLNSKTEVGGPKVLENANVIIDLNGKTITLTQILRNNGTLDIYSSEDNGKITCEMSRVIMNRGVFSTNGTSAEHTMSLINTSTADVTRVIESSLNTCSITLNEKSTLEFTNKIETGDYDRCIVVNSGTTIVNGATLKTPENGTVHDLGIVNKSSDTNARIIINNGTTITTKGQTLRNNATTGPQYIEINGVDTKVNSTNSYAILNGSSNGTIQINNGEIRADGDHAIYNSSTGTINVTGGTITGKTFGIYNSADGTINVTGGNITGESEQGIRGCAGNIDITGGTITGKTYGASVMTENDKSGSIIMKGGKATGEQHGLFAADSSSITMGTDDGTVSKTAPEVISNATSGNNYGVYKDSNATFNFYDGKITGYTGHALNAQESSKPDGYQVVKTTKEGKETAILEKEVIVTADANVGTIATPAAEGWTNKEENTKATKTVVHNTAYGTLPTATKPGYTLQGWKINGEGDFITNETILTTDSNHTLKAIWKANSYKLTKVTDSSNLIRNGDFEDYSLTNSPGWDDSLNGVPGNTSKAYYASIWHTGANMGVAVPEIGYHAHMRVIDGNAVFRYKTNEDYNGKTQADAPGGTSRVNGTVSTGRWLGASQGIPKTSLKAGKTYAITMDVYRVSGTTYVNTGVHHYITSNDTRGFHSGTVHLVPTAVGQWQTITETFTLRSDYDNTKDSALYIYGNYGAPGEFYIDNVKLEEVNTSDKNYDTSYTDAELETPTKAGYTFNGWYNNGQFETQLSTSKTFNTENAVFNNVNKAGTNAFIYAKWTANPYTVTLNAGDGTINTGDDGWTRAGDNKTATKDITYDGAYGALPTASRTGYDFDGWYTGENGTGDKVTKETKYTTDGTTTLHAKWTAKQYTVSFDSNGGTPAPASKAVTYDSTYGTLPTAEEVSKTGYTLKGWKINGEGDFITNETIVTTASDHTLKAVWETIPYTISYELNKGTKNSSNPTGYTVETENITLQNPTRNGYTFIGWTGSNGDTPQTTVTIPKGSTGNRTYTANWEEKTYTLTIKPNGGALDGSTTDVVRNLKYSDVSNINDPTRTGYSFGGYNELSGAAYNNGLASVKVYNNAHNDVVTVTPQAKSSDNPITGMSNELKISNSGTEETRPGLGGFLHSKHADANQKYVHVFVAKLPEGYYFHNANNSLGTGATKEWLTSNEGTGKWQTYVYQVNAGSSGTFNNFGYVYVSTDKDNVLGGSGRVETGAYTAYLAYSNIYDITSDDSGIGQIDGTGVLTAKWTANPYTVTLNAGDKGTINDDAEGWERSNENKTATKDITYDETYGTLPTASRTGYDFDGWYTGEDGTGDKVTKETKYTTDGTTTLHAKWTAKKYTVSFDGNGGTPTPASKSVTYDSSYGTLPTVSRTGYTLKGWKINGEGDFIANETIVTTASDHTLKAVWEANDYKVKFNGDGSTSGTVADQNFKYDQEQALNENKFERKHTVTYDGNEGTPNKANDTATFEFKNWINKENNNEYQDKQKVKNLTAEQNGEVTLHVAWNPQAVTLPTATRNNYIFNGWYDATTGGNKIGNAGDSYIPQTNTTLYAGWRPAHYTVSVGEENLLAETLKEAITLSEERIKGNVTKATITAIMDYTDNSTATISKDIVLDLAGKTITLNKALTNNGTLDIYSSEDGAVLQSAVQYMMTNRGTLTTNKTSDVHGIQIINTCEKADSRVIGNSGDLTLNKNTTLKFSKPITEGTKNRYIVANSNIVTVNGATLINTATNSSNESGISNISSATNGRIIINSGTIEASGNTIWNNGGTGTNPPAVEINGTADETKIIANNTYAVANSSTGTIKITGGTITGKSHAVMNAQTGTIDVSGGVITGGLDGIYNDKSGTINVSGNARITCTSGHGIVGYTGSVNVSGGTIEGSSDGIYLTTDEENSGSAVVTGGTIIGNKQSGIELDESSTLTLGSVNNSVPDRNTPLVKSNASDNYYGVYVGKNAIFNYYDGKIVANQTTTYNGDNVAFKVIKNAENTEVNYRAGYKPYTRQNDTHYETVLEKQITVTFNPNGGIVNPESKKVLTNTIYGELPTANGITGYSFKGWNGKNLFNKDATPYKAGTYIHGDGTEGIHSEFSIYQIDIKPSTTYTITTTGKSTNPGYVVYDASGNRVSGENFSNRKVVTFTTPSNAKYMRFSVVTLTSSYRYEKEIFQIEEGSTATPYEPYFVTAETTVTTEKDHTLTAKWEANPYTVKFDSNGGTGTMADQNFKYDEKKALTENTFTRDDYSFMCWNTKADGSGTNYSNKEEVSNLTSEKNGSVTLYAQWTKFKLSTTEIYLNKTSPTNSIVIAPEGTTGAKVTYSGENIGELIFNSTQANVVTIETNSQNTQATVTSDVSAEDNATTVIEIKDKRTGLKVAELTVKIDITPPEWLINFFQITRR